MIPLVLFDVAIAALVGVLLYVEQSIAAAFVPLAFGSILGVILPDNPATDSTGKTVQPRLALMLLGWIIYTAFLAYGFTILSKRTGSFSWWTFVLGLNVIVGHSTMLRHLGVELGSSHRGSSWRLVVVDFIGGIVFTAITFLAFLAVYYLFQGN